MTRLKDEHRSPLQRNAAATISRLRLPDHRSLTTSPGLPAQLQFARCARSPSSSLVEPRPTSLDQVEHNAPNATVGHGALTNIGTGPITGNDAHGQACFFEKRRVGGLLRTTASVMQAYR